MWSFCNEAACELSVKDPNGTSPQVRSIYLILSLDLISNGARSLERHKTKNVDTF